MRRGMTLAALGLLGCGASPAPRPDPDAITNTTSTTPPIASASASTAPTGAGKPLLFLPIRQSDAPLFEDELARVREAAIARFVSTSRGKFTPVTDERIAALRAVAKSGKLREDGPVCAAPPTEAAAIRAAFPDSVLGEGALLCSGEQCNGSFSVRDERYSEWVTAPSEVLSELSPSPKNPARVDDWIAAIGADTPAAPAPAMEGMGGVGYGMALGDGPIAVAWSFRFGFSAGAAEPDFKPESTVANAKCQFPKMESITMVLSVGGDGAVTRCEVRDEKAGLDAACVCKAYSEHRFDASDHERRLRLWIGRTAGPPAASPPKSTNGETIGLGGGAKRNGVLVMQQGGSAAEPFDAAKAREDALVGCFAARKGTASGRVNFAVVSTLDERGGITHTTLRAPKEALNDAETKCIGDVAKRFLFTCPEQAGEEAELLFTARW